MFTSLFQLEQKPVTVFSSDDAGAPVLTKNAGSLKTLLKACLVTGYGDKAALGWQMLFESADTLSAAFASQDPTASKYVIKINNSTTASAKISAYQSMTDIDTGVRPLAVDNEYELFDGAWRLIGHGKAFILLLDADFKKGARLAYPVLFGDLPRETKRVAPVCVFWTARKSGSTQGGLQLTLDKYPDGNTSTSNLNNNIQYTNNYPVVVNAAAAAANITISYSKFNYDSASKSQLLYDPYIISLHDNTWSIIPMIQPLSAAAPGIANLGTISDSAIKVSTSNLEVASHHSDCAVPTDWWWA